MVPVEALLVHSTLAKVIVDVNTSDELPELLNLMVDVPAFSVKPVLLMLNAVVPDPVTVIIELPKLRVLVLATFSLNALQSTFFPFVFRVP